MSDVVVIGSGTGLVVVLVVVVVVLVAGSTGVLVVGGSDSGSM